MKKLSIIIPVYNEERTVGKLLKNLLAIKLPVKKVEYIIVDDGSIDGSGSIISKFQFSVSTHKIIKHKKNLGKGAAVWTGIQKATGDYIIIQDADLEYNPKDIIRLVEALEKSDRKVVYGTRLKHLPHFELDEHGLPYLLFFIHYLGNRFLSLVTSILYYSWLTDMECCYKLFPKEALKKTKLDAKGFEFEPEITAKLLKRGYKIQEVAITTKPRGYKEGKKIHAIQDGIKALWTLLKYRFVE